MKSIRGNTCAQFYTNGKFTKVLPMTSRKDVGKTLTDFSDDVGIPNILIMDGAAELTGRHTEFMKEVNRLKVQLHQAKKGRKNQNYAAEREIGEVKKRWFSRMNRKKIPQRVWDFGLIVEGKILSRIARGSDGRTGHEEVMGQTPDILEWIDFEFYDLVWWWDTGQGGKPGVGDDPRQLARWLGPSHRVGSDLCYWLITESGKLLSNSSVQHVTRDDYLNPEKKAQIEEFNRKLEERLDDRNFMVEGAGEYAHLFMDDVEDFEENLGVVSGTTPTDEEYDDMLVNE